MKSKPLLLVLFMFMIPSAVICQTIPTGLSKDSIDIPEILFVSRNQSFYLYKPISYNSQNSPIWFVIHGTGGTGAGTINNLSSIADRRGALMVGLTMSGPGTTMNSHTSLASALDSNGTSTTGLCDYRFSGSVIMKHIYNHLLIRENRINIPCYLSGFSAGGQFVSRYMLFRQAFPDSIPLKMAMSMSPIGYTFPTDTFLGVPQPFVCGIDFDSWKTQTCPGANNFYNWVCNDRIVNYYNENYAVCVGDLDLDSQLNGGCYDITGATRLDRARNFYAFCDSNAITRGTTLNWQYQEIPGAGHDEVSLFMTKWLPTDSFTIAESILFDTPYNPVTFNSPVADFYADTLIQDPGDIITFTNLSSNATSYLWDFGDSTTSTAVNPTHSYTAMGKYNVQLFAYNNSGCEGWVMKRNYIIIPSSLNPKADFFQKTFGASVAFGTYLATSDYSDGDNIINFGTSTPNPARSHDFFLVKMKPNGDTLWTSVYGGSDIDFCYDGIQTSDKGFLLSGRTKSFGTGQYKGYLVKTDSSGVYIWSKTYDSVLELKTVIQTADGGFLCGGDGGVLIKTDANGDTLWTKIYTNCSIINKIIQLRDSGYVFVGQTTIAFNQKDIFISKTDKSGNIQWAHSLGSSIYDIVSSLKQTTDSGFIFCGVLNSNGSFLIKTDSSGNIIWSKNYSSTNATDVIQTSDGGYALLTSIPYINLIKTDQWGAIEWAKTYGVNTPALQFQSSSVRPTPEKGYLFNGTYGHIYGYLVKTDSLGNSGCYETIANITDSTLNLTASNFPTQGNPYTIFVNSPPTSAIRQGVFNTLCTYTGFSEVIPNENNLITIYPNPNTGIFNITFSKTLDQGNITVYNMLGQCVYKNRFTNQSMLEIQLNSTQKGLYLVNLTYGKNHICKKIIVE